MKRILSFAAALMLILSLAACGTVPDPISADASETPEATDAPTAVPTEAPTEAPVVPTAKPEDGQGDPLPADERILQVKRLVFSGDEAANAMFPDGSRSASVEFQFITLDGASAARWPMLSKALEAEASFSDSEIYDRTWILFHSLCETVEHTEHNQFDKGELRMEAFTRRADSRALSVLYKTVSTFMGDTYYHWYGETFDAATGKRLELSDVVTDVGAFTDAVNAKLGSVNVSAADWSNDTDLSAPAWTLDHDGVSVFISDDTGEFTAFLPFSEYPELFKTEYLPETESFTVEFPLGTRTFIETVNGSAEVRITGTFESNEYPEWFFSATEQVSSEIELNEKVFSFDEVYFSPSASSMYLYSRSGGRDYIYIMGNNNVDSDELFVFELADGRVEFIGGFACLNDPESVPELGPNGISGTVQNRITDPHDFVLTYSVGPIGTVPCTRRTGVCSDGMPKKRYEVYYVDQTELVLYHALEAELVNEDGTVIGSITLSEGDKVLYYRSNSTDWADLRTDDGQLARVHVIFHSADDPAWEAPNIDGIDLYSIFKDQFSWG